MAQLLNEIRYCVDGHEFLNEDSNWAGDGQYAPFRIFDIAAQDFLGPMYQTRAEAERALEAMLNMGELA